MNALLDRTLLEYRQQLEPPTAHPDLEALLEYALSDPSAPQPEALVDHCDACPSCSDLVLNLRLEQQGQRPEQDIAEEQAWQRLQDRLASAATTEHATPPLPLPQPVRVWWKNIGFAYGLAAALALALLIQSRPTAPAPAITSEIQVLSLTSQNGGSTRSADTTLNAKAGTNLLLQLATATLTPYPAYEVRIQPAEGPDFQCSLSRSPDGAFLLWIPAGQLAPGHYTLTTFGIDQDRSQPLDRYELDIDQP